MERMIDLQAPVCFYDDRNQADMDFRLSRILYQDGEVCLCKATPMVRPGSQLARDIARFEAAQADPAARDKITAWWILEEEFFLFRVASGEVLSKDFSAWYATNDITVNGYHAAGAAAPAVATI